MHPTSHSRRAFVRGAAAATALLSNPLFGQQTRLPQRSIPSTGEMLPIIGLGSSKGVSELSERGTGPLHEVLRTLVEHGGSVVDTWPRNADNDRAFGTIINDEQLRDALFVTSKIDTTGRAAGIAQFEQTLQHYGREQIDLIQIFSLTDLNTHWPSLQQWKERGLARYIGVTVSEERLYPQLEDFLARERPDFIQLNYSVTETAAEQRMLPLAADSGIAVLINRPFMNGALFRRLADTPLPPWTAEFGCSSWAQFSLKYILPNTALTCVLTETSNFEHMAENAAAALGDMPTTAQRQQMRTFIETL